MSLGASGVYALVSFIGSLTAHQSLSSQHVIINGTQAPGRPLLDLFLQLVSLGSGVAPVLLVFYLLARNGEGPRRSAWTGPSRVATSCAVPRSPR